MQHVHMYGICTDEINDVVKDQFEAKKNAKWVRERARRGKILY